MRAFHASIGVSRRRLETAAVAQLFFLRERKAQRRVMPFTARFDSSAPVGKPIAAFIVTCARHAALKANGLGPAIKW
jgi:hypothetical protein